MRSLSVLVLSIASCVCALAAPYKYTITVNGQKLGTGTVELKILPDRGVQAKIGMKIAFGGTALETMEEQNYAKDGMPTVFRNTRVGSTGNETSDRIFGPKSLTIKTTKGGKTTSKTYPYPATGTLKSASTFWFMTVKPKVGATDVSWYFNEATQKWEPSTTKYTGDQTITVGGKSYKAHVLQNQNGKFYVDDKGVPYRMEILESGATILMERS